MLNKDMSMSKPPHRLRATELYCTGNLFRHKVQKDRTKYNRKSKHRASLASCVLIFEEYV